MNVKIYESRILVTDKSSPIDALALLEQLPDYDAVTTKDDNIWIKRNGKPYSLGTKLWEMRLVDGYLTIDEYAQQKDLREATFTVTIQNLVPGLKETTPYKIREALRIHLPRAGSRAIFIGEA